MSKPLTLKRTKVLFLPEGAPSNHRVTFADGSTGWATNAKPLYVQRGKDEHGKPLPSNISMKPGKHFTASFTDDELDRAYETAKKHDWVLIERDATIVVTPPDRHDHLDGDLDCNTDLLDALNAAAVEISEAVGKKVTIFVRSGRRTMEEQWALFNANMHYVGGKWVPRPDHALTAYPNANAPHVRGVGADCGINGVNIGQWGGVLVRKIMLKHGLCLPVPSESWHVELGGRERWAPNWLPAS